MSAHSVIVGQQIGRGNVKEARSFYQSANKASAVILIIVIILLLTMKESVLKLFLELKSDNGGDIEIVKSWCNYLYPIVLPAKSFDIWQFVQ